MTKIKDPSVKVEMMMREVRRGLREFDMWMAYENYILYIRLKHRALRHKDLYDILEEFYTNSIDTWGEYKNGKYYAPIRYRQGTQAPKIRWHS